MAKLIKENNKHVKVGNMVTILEDRTGHGWKKGTEIEVVGVTKTGSGEIRAKSMDSAETRTLILNEYEITPITKEYLNTKVTELQAQINELNVKLQWLDYTGADAYDEEQFKVYNVLKLLDDKSMNLVEKTKLITNLIQS